MKLDIIHEGSMIHTIFRNEQYQKIQICAHLVEGGTSKRNFFKGTSKRKIKKI
jgi:hypothetical protein